MDLRREDDPIHGERENTMTTVAAKPERRKLKFSSYEEVIEDAKRLHASPHLQLGNWSLGTAVMHLAKGMHASIDGVDFPVSTKLKILGRLIFRPVILYWRFPQGAKLPKRTAKVLIPEGDVDFDEAMAHFQRGIERLRTESHRFAHPIIGRLSVRQWDRFHLQHAALHLSFFVPDAE